jgi:hypothetical protein
MRKARDDRQPSPHFFPWPPCIRSHILRPLLRGRTSDHPWTNGSGFGLGRAQTFVLSSKLGAEGRVEHDHDARQLLFARKNAMREGPRAATLLSACGFSEEERSP